MGLRLSHEEQKMLFEKFDVNKEGHFNYDTFVRLNGDKRGTYLETYQPGRRQHKEKTPREGVVAVIEEEAESHQITEAFAKRRG
jgi:hypothetical protein